MTDALPPAAPPAAPAGPAYSGPGLAEFVILLACMIGLTAFSIDNLLPAFDAIRQDYGLQQGNAIQLTITAYILALSVMQLVYGPASDLLGRRRPVLVGLGIYALGCILALASASFEVLVLARVLQGGGAAVGRGIGTSIVRDRFEGAEMARVMSFVMIVFLMVPVVAPAIGQGILSLGGWHWLFAVMLGLDLALMLWVGLRLPETLPPERRMAPRLRPILAAFGMVVTRVESLGPTVAQGLLLGGLMGYIHSAQQIFARDIYGLGERFPLLFAGVAITMGIAAFTNGRLVRRLGLRRLTLAAMTGYAVLGLGNLALSLLSEGAPPLWPFAGMLAVMMGLFAMAAPNLNAMAMQPLGHVAGTAGAFTGFLATLLGVGAGLAMGQAYDQTVLPLTAGMAALGLLALLLTLLTAAREPGR